MTARIEITAVDGLPEVRAGDDVARLVASAAPDLRDGDVVVVTSKVVSKAEGRLVDGTREQHLPGESVRVVAARGDLRIVETRHGLVLAAAGIDTSNVPAGQVALLPVDPDASARRIRVGIRELTGADVGVVVSDTMGRAWRDGLVDAAIGAAGFDVVEDLRGEVDGEGHRLEATVVATADEVAAAADLVKRKLAGTPVAVVRGLPLRRTDPDAGARRLVRAPADDLFRLGTRDAMQQVVTASRPARSVGAPPDPAAVQRAVRAADGFGRLDVIDGGRLVRGVDESLQTGVAIGRLLAALAAEGLAACWTEGDPPTLRIGEPAGD